MADTDEKTDTDTDESPEEPNEERLEELGDHIDAARAAADDALPKAFAEDGKEFHESGDKGKDDDDQSIAPG